MAGEGTWRPFLDEVILKGGRAYGLRMLSVKAMHQAKLDLASSRLSLGSIAAIHTLCATALGNVDTYASDADTALDQVIALLAADGPADAALDQVDTQMTEVTGASKALANAVAELGKINANLTAAEGVWSSEEQHMTPVGTSAEGFLGSGGAFINAVNLGNDVARLYKEYAETEVALAALWDSKRKDFLTEAEGHVSTMNGYLAEAMQRISVARAFIDEGQVRVNVVQTYINEAAERLGICQEFTREAEGRLAEMQIHIVEAEQFQLSSDRELAISDRYRSLSTEAMVEFQTVLHDRAQYRTNIMSSSVRQPA